MKLIRDQSKGPYEKAIVLYRKRHLPIYPTLSIVHAHKDGGPVLRDESSWRTISGIMVNTRWGYAIIQFRGFGR